MQPIKREIIPAGHARAFFLKAGQFIKISETDKCQVGDLIAYLSDDFSEHVSPAHTRCALKSIYLKKGDCLYSNRRRKILKIIEMTSLVNDMLYPSCDVYRYREFGITGYHRNCVDNFRDVLSDYGINPEEVCDPVNLFENVPVKADGTMDIKPPVADAGDFITFKALCDVIIAVSACPMDAGTNDTNGGSTADLLAEIFDPPEFSGLL